MAKVDVKVPDIGDFQDVPVIEVLVKPGDVVKVDQSLITLESDKATMDVPSPVAGEVAEVVAKVGDKVSMGTLIARVESAESGDGAGFRRCRKGGHAGRRSFRQGRPPPRTPPRLRKPLRPRRPPLRPPKPRRSTSRSPISATSPTCRSSRFW